MHVSPNPTPKCYAFADEHKAHEISASKKKKKKEKVQANLLFHGEDKTTAVPLAQYLLVKPCVCLNKRVGELQTSPWAEGTVSAAKHQASFKAGAPGLLLIPPLQLALPSLQARTRKSLKVDYDNKKNNQPTPKSTT